MVNHQSIKNLQELSHCIPEGCTTLRPEHSKLGAQEKGVIIRQNNLAVSSEPGGELYIFRFVAVMPIVVLSSDLTPFQSFVYSEKGSILFSDSPV